MKANLWKVLAALCAVVLLAAWTLPACAQASDKKEKPAMYTYVAFWDIPRAQWGEMEKASMADEPVLQKALGSGTLVGYGHDVNLVHTADGISHDDWWSSMSMAGLMNVLDQFYKSGSTTSPALASATKHWDQILVSRHYNWKPGTYKDAYLHGSSYKLKPDAPDEAVEMLSNTVMVPLMEKMMASGAIQEYDIDTEAIHSDSPGTFWVFYIASSAEGLDKVNAGLREMLKTNPTAGPAFGSMVDFKEHRDYLARTNAVYK